MLGNPSPILQDLQSLGIRPPQGVAVAANRALTQDDLGKTIDCTAATLTLTVPVGLSPDFECQIIPNGVTSIASDGTALLNGATTTITRNSATAANTKISLRMRTTQNSFVLTGV